MRDADQLLNNPCESVSRDLAEVFSKEAPDRLENEVSEDIGICCPALLELVVQVGDVDDCFAGKFCSSGGKDRLAASEKEKRVVVIRDVP